MDDVLFEFKRGRTYERDFEIQNYHDEVDKVLFTVCENEGDKNYVLRKSLGEGITLTDTGTLEDGIPYMDFNLLIDATDTDKMKVDKEYPFDIVLYSGEEKIPVINGILNLKGTSTKTYNERR